MKLDIPKKPRIRLKEQPPDQRSFTVAPLRAATDRGLTPMELRALLVFCSYVNKGGVAWVGLERIGSDLGVGMSRAHKLVTALTKKGYMRTIHKGFSGVVAHTRQVIYKEGIDADEAATISGELAPFQIRQQQKEQEAMEKKQAKRKPRKAKAIEPGYQTMDNNSVELSSVRGEDQKLVGNAIHQANRFNHLHPDILALAIAHAGDGASDADIEAAVDRLLR